MKIGIIVAMEKELKLLLPMISDLTSVSSNGVKFYSGSLEGNAVVACQSGIGKVNAAVATLTMIEQYRPDIVINTGVAGGTGATDVLDVVIPDRIAYHDVWCGPDTVPGQAAECPPFFTTALDKKDIETLGGKTGVLASGDIFVSRKEEVEHILSLYPDAVAVDMESAAIAQVCYLRHVPFICIRVISDTPGGEDNITQYENFWTDAPATTFHTLKSLLRILHP